MELFNIVAGVCSILSVIGIGYVAVRLNQTLKQAGDHNRAVNQSTSGNYNRQISQQ